MKKFFLIFFTVGILTLVPWSLVNAACGCQSLTTGSCTVIKMEGASACYNACTTLGLKGVYNDNPCPPAPVTSPVAVGVSVDPANNVMCWTERSCVNDWDKDGKPNGMWEADTNESIKACGNSGQYGFCYAPQEPYNLSVSLPLGGSGVTTVQGLGDYINKLYIFLLSISGIFAVLMIMVAGVQYIVAHGGSGATKAKERIGNAIVGLILLFLANLILFTVNPQLIRLMLPQIPKARTVFFIEDGISCETLLAQNTSPNVPYEIVPESGHCGDDNVEILVNGSSSDPKKYCSWSTCSSSSTDNPVMACITNNPGEPGQCLGCNQVFKGNSFGVEVASETCARLSAENVVQSETGSPEPHLKIKQQCFETGDSEVVISGRSCALMTLDCVAIKTCSDYADVPVTSGSGNGNLGDIQKGISETDWYSDLSFEEVCSDDPCGVSRKLILTEAGKSCVFHPAGSSIIASTLIGGVTGGAVGAVGGALGGVVGAVFANDSCISE